MHIIKTLEGMGMLAGDGTDIETVLYRIAVHRNQHGMLIGEGTIRAPLAALIAAFEARVVTLVRQDTGDTLRGKVIYRDLQNGIATVQLLGDGLDN